jgi:GxxExxY protein
MGSNESESDRTRLVYPKLSYELTGVLYKVQNTLGSGLLEKHYQKAIELELIKRKLKYEREKYVRLEYNGELIGKYYVDFLIATKIVLEVKATRDYSRLSYKQAYSYLRQLRAPLAVVVNFHGNSLKLHRIVNPDYENIDLSNG